MGPVNQLSRGSIPHRSASLPTREPSAQRPKLIDMPRQHSFRCLDAVLAEPNVNNAKTAPYSPSTSSSPSTPRVMETETEGLRAADGERAGGKLRQLFRKKTPSPQPVPARESFFCADAQALEEAYQSSRDRYEGANVKPEASPAAPAYAHFGHGVVPGNTPMAKELPARNLMAEALAQRAKDQRLSPPPRGPASQARPSRRFVPPTAPPPVPPLPEQYRRRDMPQRI